MLAFSFPLAADSFEQNNRSMNFPQKSPLEVLDLAVRPLEKYFDFTGRARRLEVLLFALVSFVGFGVAAVLGGILGLWFLPSLFWLAIAIPSIAVTVRRFHDIGKSGWWILTFFIPVVGQLVALVLMCWPGAAGVNRYGPDPRG